MEYPDTVAKLTETLREGGYLADRGLATALFVGLSLHRPVLLEGEVGVGKTEVAKVLADILGRRLIRLQCYEGIDTNQALYEWDYARQMLYIRALSERALSREGTEDDAVNKVFGPRFLLERPLLDAVRAGDQAVLLIDEVDRADDEFEAFLLEVLSDFQISIPEIGTIKAERPPLVLLTSNRTRELHDALKRRCLYHWIGYPPPEREVEIVLVRAPGVSEMLAGEGRRGGQPAPRDGTGQATGRRRDHRLGADAGLPRRDRTGHPGRRGHPGRGDQRTGRPGTGPGQPGRDHLRCLSARLPPWSRLPPVARPPPRRARAETGSVVALLVNSRRTPLGGPSVGSGDVLTYCAAVGALDPTDLLDLYWGGRTTLVTRRENIAGLRPGVPPVLPR